MSTTTSPDPNIERVANGLKHLTDPTRLTVIALLAARPHYVGELCEAIGDTQPHMSHHLARLRSAGLVDTTRRGRHVVYETQPALYELVRSLNSLVGK
jgi:DNA-binding transcriptional ArsR family regulator